MKCYGRVNDLEEMVPESWWQTVFSDDLYLKTDGDVVEDPEITAEEVGLLLNETPLKQMLSSNRGISRLFNNP